MRKSFYPKMAWSGISHNRKLYIPYFFTCIAMVMMFYIIDALSVRVFWSGSGAEKQCRAC